MIQKILRYLSAYNEYYKANVEGANIIVYYVRIKSNSLRAPKKFK